MLQLTLTVDVDAAVVWLWPLRSGCCCPILINTCAFSQYLLTSSASRSAVYTTVDFAAMPLAKTPWQLRRRLGPDVLAAPRSLRAS
mmetsp:Transcript_13579/g.26246  ORF Transcript_13579/g.26246 Transcript_13579/m.26246 type:complete len:86 (+) Transcript_13579:2879-3136(+)